MTPIEFPVAEFGWGGVVLFLVWMLFTGRIITGREARDKDDEILYWRKASDKKDAAIAEAHKILGEFREVIGTNNAVLQALFEVAQEKERERDRDRGRGDGA